MSFALNVAGNHGGKIGGLLSNPDLLEEDNRGLGQRSEGWRGHLMATPTAETGAWLARL